MHRSSDDILVLLFDISRLVRVEADRRARVYGLTRAQWVILSRVASTPGLSQRELAEGLEVEPMTVGRLVDRLEQRTLVERRPDSADRRIWRVHLLPAAVPILAELEHQRAAIVEMLERDVPRRDMDLLRQTLAAVKTNIGSSVRPGAARDSAQPLDPGVLTALEPA